MTMFDSNDNRTAATEQKFEKLAAPAVGAAPVPLFLELLVVGLAPGLFLFRR